MRYDSVLMRPRFSRRFRARPSTYPPAVREKSLWYPGYWVRSLVRKWLFLLMQIKLIFTRKASHLASFWKWEFLKLRHGLFAKTKPENREKKRKEKRREKENFRGILTWYSKIPSLDRILAADLLFHDFFFHGRQIRGRASFLFTSGDSLCYWKSNVQHVPKLFATFSSLEDRDCQPHLRAQANPVILIMPIL